MIVGNKQAIAGWYRAAVVALAVSLAGCAAPVAPAPGPVSPPPAAAAPWTAAIGRLDVAGAASCTAVLVKATLILTAAHCLHQNPTVSPPASLRFNPNLGAALALPPAQGQRLVALGGDVREGHLARPEQIMKDWALIEIAPAVTGVAPLPLASLSTDEAVSRLAHGGTLFTAGYGQGWMKRLEQHSACGIVEDPHIFASYRNRLLVTNCIIRIGDSGGPIILMDSGGKPRFLGIFAGFDTRRGLSYAVATGPILRRLAQTPVSALPASPLPLAILSADVSVASVGPAPWDGQQHGRD
ncbi:trypsin-like serine peptidase [Dongia rigui]|uniref:Trypsin-like serine protease n=1 Tax=Dongia rigui TaxID=940149 RepID=A0ABU5DU28_9PROT|nr:trypsin-like serine protease [Dongia rigui]MDY0870821.1 trypsin-like serine protease [Dongia rigui]